MLTVWWLVLTMTGSGKAMVVMPEPYTHLGVCELAGQQAVERSANNDVGGHNSNGSQVQSYACIVGERPLPLFGP